MIDFNGATSDILFFRPAIVQESHDCQPLFCSILDLFRSGRRELSIVVTVEQRRESTHILFEPRSSDGLPDSFPFITLSLTLLFRNCIGKALYGVSEWAELSRTQKHYNIRSAILRTEAILLLWVTFGTCICSYPLFLRLLRAMVKGATHEQWLKRILRL